VPIARMSCDGKEWIRARPIETPMVGFRQAVCESIRASIIMGL